MPNEDLKSRQCSVFINKGHFRENVHFKDWAALKTAALIYRSEQIILLCHLIAPLLLYGSFTKFYETITTVYNMHALMATNFSFNDQTSLVTWAVIRRNT